MLVLTLSASKHSNDRGKLEGIWRLADDPIVKLSNRAILHTNNITLLSLVKLENLLQ